jgi:hypothetical protein
MKEKNLDCTWLYVRGCLRPVQEPILISDRP